MLRKRRGKRTAKYRFELLIPTSYNDRRPVETAKIQQVWYTLIDRFGGCRVQPAAPYQGWWIQLKGTARKPICAGLKPITARNVG